MLIVLIVILLHLHVIIRDQFWGPSPQGCLCYVKVLYAVHPGWWVSLNDLIRAQSPRRHGLPDCQTAKVSHR